MLLRILNIQYFNIFWNYDVPKNSYSPHLAFELGEKDTAAAPPQPKHARLPADFMQTTHSGSAIGFH
jgi:hypothetical protein